MVLLHQKITINHSHVMTTYLLFSLADVIKERSDPCIKTFVIGSKNGMLNFTIVSNCWSKCSELMIYQY